MIVIEATEVKAEQRKYALRMLQRCVQTLQDQDEVDRELLQEAASWAAIAEALRRRT